MKNNLKFKSAGPFLADQLHDGDPYELSNGHPIYCMPGVREHADSNLTGGAVVSTDPDVEWSGIDAGYAPQPGMLRAPDIAVGTPGDEKGWIQDSPLLAVEYAGIGQDEDELQNKISDLKLGRMIFLMLKVLRGCWELRHKQFTHLKIQGTTQLPLCLRCVGLECGG